MSDEDDWMALADKPLDQIKVKTEEKEVVEFIDKPKPEIKIESQPRNEENAAKKNKLADAGKKHDDKRKLYEDTFNEKQPKKLMTQEERLLSEQLSKKSDERNINELFMDVIGGDKQQSLEDREAYIQFAKKIGGLVGEAKLKIYIQDFMTQLIEEIYPKITTVEYQAIADKTKVMFNQKQKEEKPAAKKKTKGPTANITKGTVKSTATYDESSDEYDAPKGKYADDDFM